MLSEHKYCFQSTKIAFRALKLISEHSNSSVEIAGGGEHRRSDICALKIISIDFFLIYVSDLPSDNIYFLLSSGFIDLIFISLRNLFGASSLSVMVD